MLFVGCILRFSEWLGRGWNQEVATDGTFDQLHLQGWGGVVDILLLWLISASGSAAGSILEMAEGIPFSLCGRR